jgi:hypothetical protein
LAKIFEERLELMKKLFCTLTALVLLAQACTMTAPSMNWEKFDSKHIDKKRSKTDTSNVYKVIIWESRKRTYTEDTLNNYTGGKHWQPLNNGEKDTASINWFRNKYRITGWNENTS